jgi:hypothetical protein
MVSHFARWWKWNTGALYIAAFTLLMIVLVKPLHRYLSSLILWYLEQLGKRESVDRFES